MATGIIFIDPYNDFLHPEGKLNQTLSASMAETGALKNLKRVLEVARERKLPVFYCLHQQSRPHHLLGWQLATRSQKKISELKVFEEGSWGAKIFEGMEPVLDNGDVIVSKHWNRSAFANTDLDYQLRQKGIRNVVVAGMIAETCFDSTARYAYESGYAVTTLIDATAGFSQAGLEASAEYHWPLYAEKSCTTSEWIESLAETHRS